MRLLPDFLAKADDIHRRLPHQHHPASRTATHARNVTVRDVARNLLLKPVHIFPHHRRRLGRFGGILMHQMQFEPSRHCHMSELVNLAFFVHSEWFTDYFTLNQKVIKAPLIGTPTWKSGQNHQSGEACPIPRNGHYCCTAMAGHGDFAK